MGGRLRIRRRSQGRVAGYSPGPKDQIIYNLDPIILGQISAVDWLSDSVGIVRRYEPLEVTAQRHDDLERGGRRTKLLLNPLRSST